MPTPTDERDALRQFCQSALDALRSEPLCPAATFELLGAILRRLDRLEMGQFASEDETPTRPERRLTPQPFRASDVTRILDEGKGKR